MERPSGENTGSFASPHSSFFVICTPLPPSVLYIQTSTVPSELRSVRRRRTTIHRPSGDHAGELVKRLASRVTGRTFEPSASIIQTFSVPLRSLVNAIFRPSGDQRGWWSHAMPEVRRFAAPPPIGSV